MTMQKIQEALEHAKNAEFYMVKARERDGLETQEAAWIESNLAVAKAIAGLAIAILSHDTALAGKEKP
jgi:hypothetical protein